jgi:hypothetical protein
MGLKISNFTLISNVLKKSYSKKTDFLGTLPFFQARNLFLGNNFF